VHGTTLVTNPVIERKGARTGTLTTLVFTDVLDVGMESRRDLFDLRIAYGEPVVPRSRRIGTAKRMRHDGSVEHPLGEHGVRSAIQTLVAPRVTPRVRSAKVPSVRTSRAMELSQAVSVFHNEHPQFTHQPRHDGPLKVLDVKSANVKP
jgi:hypothetical protein